MYRLAVFCALASCTSPRVAEHYPIRVPDLQDSGAQTKKDDTAEKRAPLLAVVVGIMDGDVERGFHLGTREYKWREVAPFIEVKMSRPTNPTFSSAAGLGPERSRFDEGKTLNVGATYWCSDHLAGFLGVGYGERREIIQYAGRFVEADRDGGVNVVAGASAFFGILVLEVSYDTFLESTSVSVGSTWKLAAKQN